MILAIYGAAGFGKEIYDMVHLHMRDKWDDVIYIDDMQKCDTFRGTKLMNYEKFREAYSPDEACVIIAQGQPNNKKLLYDRIKRDGFTMPVLVHPNAYVAEDAVLGEGTVIFTGCTVSSTVKMGVCSAALTYTLIGHDTTVGDFCQISAMVLINGDVFVGNKVFIGGGARIRERINIGDNSIVAMAVLL